MFARLFIAELVEGCSFQHSLVHRRRLIELTQISERGCEIVRLQLLRHVEDASSR
jgi:hypothetical protein